jgi:DNA-binding NarL/FixJ family response regulator
MTARQQEVLRYIAAGATNPEIARELGISTETAKSHVRDILSALGARSRAHAVAIAFREGEIE